MLTFNFNKVKLDNNSGVMLDLGCGEGRHIFGAMQQFPDLQCVGLDPHLESLDKSQEGLELFESLSNNTTTFLSGSAYSLPFADSTFDLVVCSEVLEHLHEYRDAITEINRVLKPGGKFLASVPAEFPERICWALSKEYQNQPGGHLRIFKKKILFMMFLKEGLNLFNLKGFIQFILPIGGCDVFFGSRKKQIFLLDGIKNS